AVADVVARVDLKSKSDALGPRVGFAEETMVVPQRRFEHSPLVAKEALQERLVRLGHAAGLLEEGCVADSLLAVDQVGKLDNEFSIRRHRSPPSLTSVLRARSGSSIMAILIVLIQPDEDGAGSSSRPSNDAAANCNQIIDRNRRILFALT